MLILQWPVNLQKKEKCAHFFESSSKRDEWKCNICSNIIGQVKTRGYQNLISHLNKQKDIVQVRLPEMGQPSTSSLASFGFHCSSKKAVNIFSWIEWIVMEQREFSFCEKALVKKYLKLEPISRGTFIRYIQKLTEKTEE